MNISLADIESLRTGKRVIIIIIIIYSHCIVENNIADWPVF